MITENQIAERKVAGASGQGNPVVYIVSKGGLHAFFCKKDGEVHSLGAAPHRAIAMFLAEKHDPDLKWNKEFVSKSSDETCDLTKSIANKFNEVRTMFFSQEIRKSEDETDEYTVYDTANREFLTMSKAEIIESVKDRTLDRLALVRLADLSGPIMVAQEIE